MDDAEFWKHCWIPKHRCWGEYLGDVRVKYHYVCGHTRTVKMVSAQMAKFFGERWHTKDQGGCAGRCRRCVKQTPGSYVKKPGR